MLERVITWSLRHRLVVLAGWAVIAVIGALALGRLRLDAFPDITPVMVQVNTTAPALGPLEMERQVTARVEQVLSGLPGLVEVRSLSRFGLSQVTCTFAEDVEPWLARQTVAERLQTVELPGSVARPTLGPMATGLGEIFHYLITGEHSLTELRTIHDWVIKPQLSAVPGVAEINAWGGREAQVHVVVDPARLHARGLSIGDLAQAIEANNANAGGGTIEEAGGVTLVQGVGVITSAEDLARVVITARDGVPVRVGDVADVVPGYEIRRGAVTHDGQGEAVLGLGFMLVGENPRDVTRRLAVRLEEIRKSLPAGVKVEPVLERTTLVDAVIRTVRTNLLEGAILVVAVLFAFLGSWRAGLIVASAIPLSMLFAFDLMTRAGIAGSLMSLGAIDFGLVVDSSVIMVENCMRRLGLDAGARPRIEVVRDAALEVRKPTMFGELIIMIVYLPVLTLEGMEGQLFRPMALTVTFALLGSMLLSLTLMPVLASLALPRRPPAREPALVRALQRAYAPVLGWALRNRAAVLAGAVGLLVVAAVLAGRLGSEFVPRLREGSLAINTVRLSGVALDEAVRQGTQVERLLLASFPEEIERIWTRTGSAEVATDPMGIELSDVFVTLAPRKAWTRARTQDELVRLMEEELVALPGMRTIFTQPIEMRVNEMVAGVRADVGVKVFGDDLERLRDAATEVERVLRTIPGAADVSAEQLTGQPVLQVVVDREALSRLGIPASEVLSVVEALGGIELGEVQEGERRFPIAMRLPETARAAPEVFRRMSVATPGGERIPLEQLARFELVEGPAAIQREWGRRRVVVSANVRGRDVGSFVEEARAVIDERVALPEGWYVRFGGQFEHYQRARARLMIVVPLALSLIFLLLYFTYGRLLDALRVFTGVPFAAVGGVLALWLRDMPFSISAGVGFVALSGVAVLGDMVLVSTIRQLLDEGLPVEEAVPRAARRRLRPVVMTSLVASLGFVPMAFNTGLGAEVQRPLATVVIGGVLSSMALTLVVLPVLYVMLARRGTGLRNGAPAATVTVND